MKISNAAEKLAALEIFIQKALHFLEKKMQGLLYSDLYCGQFFFIFSAELEI